MDEVAQIREKIDIVSFISEFIPLKKMGRNFKANCPFHNEKTPSFVVSPERQIWHCFGCLKGGDAYTFLMEYEHMDFGEALRILAKRTGVTLATTNTWDSGISAKKEKLFSINHLAAEFYHYVLTKHAVGKSARKYLLEERQMSEPLLKTFMIGYSPKSGNALASYLLNKKKYKADVLVEAGLAYQRNGRYVDFFKNRIMFPLTDVRGNIVGFSGRSLTDNLELGPKYINTRETIVYHKGDLFFGLDTAKDEMKKEGSVLIMEGEFDVISSFKSGVGNAVAVKGTALTENQVSLLSRFVQKVSLCFDQDAAGFEATKRSLPILEKKGLTTTIVVLKNAKDPDEAVKNDEVAFKVAVKHDVPVYDFLLTRFENMYDAKTAEGKKKITDDMLPLLQNIDNEIVREHYVKKLAAAVDTSYESVVLQLEKLEKKLVVKDAVLPPASKKRDRKEVLEEYILALIIQGENTREAVKKAQDILKDYAFEAPASEKLLQFIHKFSEAHPTFDSKALLEVLPQELVKTFDTCFLLPIPKFDSGELFDKELTRVAHDLKTLYLKKRIKELSEEVKEKEKSGSQDELMLLREKLQKEILLLSKIAA